ncbi:class E sortase [Egibacter rhizosphaerae]|uniref:Class E sortase n=1 Tax=Egibacter rhizosphaerae TaxID=1670831 RepID=A0A411YFN7_9ACTN|nr:sortase [Egibacter rhizosphaerae]QBI19989.1 class E sortase [Egibacter rhizosphaerae]
MTATAAPEARSVPAPRHRRSWPLLALRGIGWTLTIAGAVILLYVVYALWFTGLETDRAQTDLLEQWEAGVGALDPEGSSGTGDSGGDDATTDGDSAEEAGDRDPPTVAEAGGEVEAPDVAGGASAVAVIAFERPGSDEPPVLDEPVAVLGDVTVADLRNGPGHYPSTADPGDDSNFAVAGHRVTYSAPFRRLDELREGDRIHVWDLDGERHEYEFSESRIVLPTETWVLDDDPVGLGAGTITLTTCHPVYSDRERLVTFGELVP